MDNSPLKYADETDRVLGLTGMTISMLVWDGEEYLTAVSLDNRPGEGLELSPDFHFAGNPRLSARLAWNSLVKHWELSSAMAICNVACRAYLRNNKRMSSSLNAALKALVRDEGRTICSLDDDEIDRIYAKTFDYADRIFSHAGVMQVARNFADSLSARRRLTAAEAFDLLSPLNNL